MLETAIVSIYGIIVLFFGIVLSFAFSGIRFTRKSMLAMLVFGVLSGLLQFFLLQQFSDAFIWRVYPLVVHLPLILFLYSAYRKRLVTVVVAVLTSYLCCQPSKVVGIIVFYSTQSSNAAYIARTIALPVLAFFILRFFADSFAKIFTNSTRSIWVFGIVPVTYYFFDYVATVFTDLWLTNNRIVIEFFPILLFVCFFLFCLVYHKEYEAKADAERQAQMIRIASEEKTKELDTIRINEQKLHMLRHDLRSMLETLALSIENGDNEAALKLVKGYSSRVRATSLHKYCENEILNYILTNYADKCEEKKIPLSCEVDIAELTLDEISLCTIVSNALDNAINAQIALPEDQRQIKVMLKTADGKFLFSVKNPIIDHPSFANGLPVARKAGHGYGTQSILYMTEQLGGKCQFLIQDNKFVLRVII